MERQYISQLADEYAATFGGSPESRFLLRSVAVSVLMWLLRKHPGFIHKFNPEKEER